jgi:hypothetical protein
MTGFVNNLYFHTVRDYRHYGTITILLTLQFTAAHDALGLWVFTSHLLAMGLSQSHWHFKSHMKFSLHSLIPFLPLLLNHLGLPSPNSTHFSFNHCSVPLLFCFSYCPAEHFLKLLYNDPTENTIFFIQDVCLQFHYLATDVLLVCIFASAGCVY